MLLTPEQKEQFIAFLREGRIKQGVDYAFVYK